jgi:hypothetical protein
MEQMSEFLKAMQEMMEVQVCSLAANQDNREERKAEMKAY